MFILMLVLTLGYGQKQITFQEFNNLSRCQAAIAEISKVDSVEKAICIQK